jgi:predicted Zn-dependent protease
MPLDDDYYGIRRSLWATTDYVYKSAARQYKENLETRKEKESAGEFNYRMFGRVPVVNLVMDVKPLTYEKSALENLVRDLSAVFLEFPELDGSAAYVSINQVTKYTVTSEGTIARVPEILCTMQVFAGLTKENGENVYDHLSYHSTSVDKLPAKEDVVRSIRMMCKKLQESAPPEFDEEYTGPVMFSGGAVADLFANSLFGYRDKLVASEMIPDPKSTRKDIGMESKIDKLVMSEDITVTVKSPLTSFKGQDVLGSYILDGEGVRPDPEFVIVAKGILKNLINDRSISQKGQTANGHNDGPGVVDIQFSKTSTTDVLKKKLLEIAKAEGLDFGVMIKANLRVKGGSQEVYKVYVSDGREELVGPVSSSVIMKNLKKDIFASSDKELFNVEAGSGGLVSYIVPSAVVISDIEVRKVETSGYEREVYVVSPLIK